MKRIWAMIMCLGLFFTVSCAAGPELLPFMPENVDDTDLGGLELRLGWPEGVSVAEYVEDTIQYDSYIARLADAEKTFNCTVLPEAKLDDYNLELDVMAGIYCLDIFIGNISSLAEKGLVHPLNIFDGILDPYDEKFGGVEYLEAGMIKGVPYGVSPVMWPGFQPEGFILAYNRDLFRTNGITDLHEYYENEIWTYDTFEKEFIAKTFVTDSNGDVITAFGTDGTDYFQCLMASNHVNFIKVNSDGTLSPDPNSRSYRNALEWGQGLFAKYGDRLNGDMETHDQPEYRNNKMFVTTAYDSQITTGNIAYNDIASIETGVMPFPCGPDAEYGVWRQVAEDFYGFGIPLTAQSETASARIIDYISEPFEEFGGDDGLYTYYVENIFTTELDAEIFLACSIAPKATYMGRGDKEMNAVREGVGDVAVDPKRSLTEAISSYQNILVKAIEKYMIPNYDAVYGDKD